MADPQEDTIELEEEYLVTITIHGRGYQAHSIRNNIHLAPVDEEEGERLLHQHRVFNIMFDDRLIFPPVSNPSRILDCGYGAASWAVDVAESYPDSEVIGVDISPQMKPDDTPENFWPQLDDLNETFTFGANRFDVVQSRMVGGGINVSRWPSYLRDIKRVLKPGGWVQMVEAYYMCQSDNGTLTDQHALRQWSTKYISSMQGLKDMRAPLRLQQMFQTAGFVEIESKMIPLPLCGWSNDDKQRRVGNAIRDHVRRDLTSLSLAPLTQRLGMSYEEFQDLTLRAAMDASHPALKAYFPLYVCIGRKPG